MCHDKFRLGSSERDVLVLMRPQLPHMLNLEFELEDMVLGSDNSINREAWFFSVLLQFRGQWSKCQMVYFRVDSMKGMNNSL